MGALFGVLPAAALELRFSYGNDFLVSNEVDDDYYTFSLGLEIVSENYLFRIEEKAFTDSERGFRFDETHVSVEGTFTPWHGWLPEATLGVLHVGEGLFGERVQNAVHGLVGDEKVELDYIDQRELHLTARLRLRRTWELGQGWWLEPRFELYATSGFRHHATAHVLSSLRLSRHFTVFGGIGGRYDLVDFTPLEAHVARSGPIMTAGLELGNGVSISWNYNQHGTRNQHVGVSYSWRPATSARR